MSEPAKDSSPFQLSANPADIGIDPARTAVVVTDMQNDFCSPRGSLVKAGFDVSAARSVIDPLARTLALVREIGIVVVYLQHGYQPDLSDLGHPQSRNAIAHLAAGVGTPFAAPDGTRGAIGIHDTWNTRIIDELAPHADETVVRKNRFSGFHNTSLDAALSSRDIDTIILTGLTTSICVEATVRDAMHRDYRPIVLSDCVAEPQGAAHHASSLSLIASTLGWVSDSQSLTRAAGGARSRSVEVK